MVPCNTSEESCISGLAGPLRTLRPGSPERHRVKGAVLQVLTPVSSRERRVRLFKAGCD